MRLAHKREQGSGMFGKVLSDEAKLKMSIAKGTTIYLYTQDKSQLINTFTSARKAAEFFKTTHRVILNHAKNELIFKEQWVISTKPFNK